jgi:hypothetical protein
MNRFSIERRIATIFGLVGGATLLALSAAQAKTQSLCVNPGGTAGCEATISSAFALITERTVTINVAAGSYLDNVTINTGVKPRSLTLTITGTSGAASTLVQSNGGGSVFTIGKKAKVTLTGLTIENGTGSPIAPGSSSLTGGGIFVDGGTLTLTSCVVSNNQADFGAGVSALDGKVTITNATISGNSAPDTASDGGAIYFTGTQARKLTIETSTIDSNSAAFGAGIILLDSEGTSLKLNGVISDSTISNNTCVVCTTSSTAHTQGAGVEVESAKLTVTNSTISGNNASGTTGLGGGILSSTGKVTIDSTTIANNTASSGGGIFVDVNNKKFTAANSIIATNNAFAGVDCTGALTSHDYNFIGGSSNCTVSDKTVHDLSGDPMLGPLQNNGGTTDTQALLIGSSALGAGNPGNLTGGSHCEATDQIGTARTKGDCDIGAYQLPD